MESPNDIIAVRAEFLAQHMRKENIRSVAILILYDLRIPTNYDGFDFLGILIPDAYQNRLQVNTSGLYLNICRKYPDTNYEAVENAVARSIRKAWSERDQGRWNYYFPDYVIQRRKPPTNTEFIKSIVYFIDLWQDHYVKEADQLETV